MPQDRSQPVYSSMRKFSTLFERYCVATLPSSVTDENFDKMLLHMRDFIFGLFPDCHEVKESKWAFTFSPPQKETPPEVIDRSLSFHYNFWSSDNIEKCDWRIHFERFRIIINYRRHTPDDMERSETILIPMLNLLHEIRSSLSFRQWDGLSFYFFFLFNCDTIDDHKLARKNWLEVRKILKLFQSLPRFTGFKAFVPPTEGKISWQQENSGETFTNTMYFLAPFKEGPPELQLSLGIETEKNCPESVDLFVKMLGILSENYTSLLTDSFAASAGGDCL